MFFVIIIYDFYYFTTIVLVKESSLYIQKCELLSRVRLCVTPWTAAPQAPLSMGLPRQEYWSGLQFPSPKDLPDPEIKPGSPALQADSLLSVIQNIYKISL